MPELLFPLSTLSLVFFLLTVIILVVMLTHHHLKEHTEQVKPHHPIVPDPSETKFPVEDLELDSFYQKSLQEDVDHLRDQITAQATKAEGDFVQYLADLRVRSEQSQSLLEKTQQDRLDKIFSDLEGNLTAVINQTVNKTLDELTAQLETARKSVENYTQKQFNVIDENIIDVLEKTLSIVLIKKLTLRDQLDLVYEALEKAKAERFFGSPAASIEPSQPTEAVNQPLGVSPNPTENTTPNHQALNTPIQASVPNPTEPPKT